ncbi:CYTH domain-containing protein [archaeon]|nr:CYTH domain-containing protein [archaeon]
MLRLRKEGEKAILTFKKFSEENKDAKSLKEVEVEVSDLNKTKEILEELNLIPISSSRKLRTSYEIEGVKFEFDKYLDENDFIPEFLEIEAHDNIILHKYINLLGFSKEDCKPWSFFQIKEYYSSMK